jgi:hypothetical protein
LELEDARSRSVTRPRTRLGSGLPPQEHVPGYDATCGFGVSYRNIRAPNESASIADIPAGDRVYRSAFANCFARSELSLAQTSSMQLRARVKVRSATLHGRISVGIPAAMRQMDQQFER